MHTPELKQKVLSYQNSNVVSKYAFEQGIQLDEAERHFQECKKFLYACSIASRPLRPSKQLDEVWHSFVLFTKDYAYFCQQYLGGFIHHVPDEVNAHRITTGNRADFEYSRTLVESIFGELYGPIWYSTKTASRITERVEAADCGGCSGLDGNCTGCSANQY